MPSSWSRLRARMVPSRATISPRGMRSCSSWLRWLSGFSRSAEASKIVQREVNATSSPNRTTTRPNRRTIGRFTVRLSFELAEFEAADQGGRVGFRAQRVVEQRAAALGAQGRGADARDVAARIEGDAAGQVEGNALVHRHEPAVVGADEIDVLEEQVGDRRD